MGYNIYDECPKSEEVHTGTEKEVAEQIFNQHESGGILTDGVPFSEACKSLSKEYKEFANLTNDTLMGHVYAFLDSNNDGHIDKDEFVDGIQDLRNQTTEYAKVVMGRITKNIVRLTMTNSEVQRVKTVAIIGAGVAGLQTARALSVIGLKVTIFEKNSDVGGVWRENYADFGLQVPRDLYEFPDFTWSAAEKKGVPYELFPKGPIVEQYIKAYAENFDLLPMIRFNTPVVELVAAGLDKKVGWTVKYEDASKRQGTEHFDFLVVATGMYGWPPHMPLARGHQNFKGQILHSCTFTDKEVARGKKVITVGGGKSAVDNAVAAAKVGVSSTLLCRSWHWPVPRYLLNIVPFKFGTYSRFGHFMLKPYHKEGNCSSWTHNTCAPVKWIWWRVVELMFRGQFRLPKEQVPKKPIEKDLFTGGQILTYEFRNLLEQKKLTALGSSIDRFTPTGVILNNGTEMEADLVIYGTGFTKNYNIFDKDLHGRLQLQKDGLYLYRNIIPPSLPDVAFIGCEVSTFNNILTHALQALWLQKLLLGKVTLPTAGRMQKVIEKEASWKRSWMPPSSARASIWQLHMTKYHDNLIRDMGESPYRKWPNCLGEIIMPYRARDYSALFEMRSWDSSH